MDDNYLKQQLATYVEFQLDNGYELADIKEALVHYGYKKELIITITKQFKSVKPKKTLDSFTKKDKEMIREDLAIYVQNMLIDYTKKQLDLGFSLQAIKKALKRQGHNQLLIDNALKSVKSGEYVDYKQEQQLKQYPISLLFSLVFIIVLVLIFIMSVAANENILLVFTAFAPAIFVLLVLYVILNYVHQPLVLQVTPVVIVLIAIGLFMYLDSATTIYKLTDKNILLTLNIVISFVASSILVMFSKKNIPFQKAKALHDKKSMQSEKNHQLELDDSDQSNNHSEKGVPKEIDHPIIHGQSSHHQTNHTHHAEADHGEVDHTETKEVTFDDDEIKAHSPDAEQIKKAVYNQHESKKKSDKKGNDKIKDNNSGNEKLKLKEFLP